MRLLYIITSLDYGGAERQLVLLATRLAKRGWQVKVVSILPPKAFVRELEKAGVSVETLGITKKWQFLSAWWELRKIIDECKPQIVHSFMVHANILSRMVRLTDNNRYCLICSVRSFNEGSRFREFLYRITDRFSDCTTHVSRFGVRKYVNIKAVSAQKVLYFPNGIGPQPFLDVQGRRKALRLKLGVGDAEFLWFAAGRLIEAKDYPNLLKAFSILSKRFNNVKLLIAGDGPLRENLEGLAQKLGLVDRVRFLGLRKDIPELMAVADAFVLSSAWEGMPNVLLEASVSGLPVVSTRVSGAEEIVEDGETGYLVPPRDSGALASAMVRIMKLPPSKCRAMGRTARERVFRNLHIDKIVDSWEKLYNRMLGGL